MNHIYRSIWSESLKTWVAVSENTSGKGKTSPRNYLLIGLLLCSSTVLALPTGDDLVAGQATVSTPAANHMQINQSSQNAIINWQGFSVQNNESVNIQQPNTSAALLNRVVGQDPSTIQGHLSANGQVYLINPNGVLFTKTAEVDANGLVASTHSMTNQDFLSGKNHFTQDNANSTATVENHGQIHTPEGGVVALIGQSVSNEGTITTPKGSSVLAAGKTVDLDFKGDGLVEVKVSEAAIKAQVNNHGAIQADGGRVVLTAKAAGQLMDTVINNQGLIRAQGMIARNGEIILDGGNSGIVQNSGTIDASGNSSGQHGGQISVTGDKVIADKNSKIDASGNTGGGNILVGSNTGTQTSSETTVQSGALINAQTSETGKAGNIKILADMQHGQVNINGKLDASAPRGGDGGFIDTSAAHVKVTDSAKITTHATQGKTGTWIIDPQDFFIAASGGDISGSTLATNLNSGNVTIESTQGATSGNGDIFVNDAVSYSSANNLTLNAVHSINVNQAISNLGSGIINLRADSQGACVAGGSLCGTINFAGSGHITASSTATVNLYYNPTGSNNASPDYSSPTDFSSNVSAVFVNAYMLVNDVMQLQAINTNLSGVYALGKNIDATASSSWNSGQGFVPLGNALNNFGGTFDGLGHSISNLTINRPSTDYVGLFGNVSPDSTVNNTGLQNISIVGQSNTGGLTGFNAGRISNAYTMGNVTGTGDAVGGLVGYNSNSITQSYTVTSVNNTGNYTGGLVGQNVGSISDSYASGSVTGTFNVGGLVGYSSLDTSSISNTYSIASVTGSNAVGGLVGLNTSGSSIDTSYASGKLTASGPLVGGLVGNNSSGTVTNSFWDTGSTGQLTSAGGGSPQNTTNLMTQSTYSNWDFIKTWWMSDTNTRPFLRMEYSTNISNSHQLQLMAMNLTASYTLANNINLTSDLAAVNSQYPGMWSSKGFVPVGDATNNFTGNFDGMNYTITGLAINRPTTVNVGLFGFINGNTSNTIANIGLLDVNIIGGSQVGGLAGANGDTSIVGSTIQNAYVTGAVQGNNLNIGGLIGSNWGTVTNTYSEVNVTTDTGSEVGGLIGYNGNGSLSTVHATGTVISNTGIAVGGLIGETAINIDKAYATGNVSGGSNVGGLIGTAGNGESLTTLTITNSYATGTVNGTSNVGGLIGSNSTNVSFSYATGKVIATDYYAGGLIGSNDGILSNVYATGNVNGTNSAGGLLGSNTGTINTSYATGNVTATSDNVGGFIGANKGTLGVVYASGNVSSTSSKVGGLIGYNTGNISNAYATGNVTGNDSVGGLIGNNDITPTPAPSLPIGFAPLSTIITNTYAAGLATGTSNVGGLIGINNNTVAGSFWNSSNTSVGVGSGSATGTTGISLADMMKLSTYTNAGWSISSVGGDSTTWRIYEGYTTPLLRSFLTPLTVTADNVSVIYNKQAYTNPLSNPVYSVATVDSSHLFNLKQPYINAINVGTYSPGLYSDQQGYDITLVNGVLSITPAGLVITANDVTKTFDGTTSASSTAVTAGSSTLFGTDSISGGSFAFLDKNAGSGKTVTVGNVTVNDGNNGNNYTVSYLNNTSSTINKAGLIVTANDVSKTYDGTLSANSSTALVSGTLFGSDSLSGGVFTFLDKNVGTGKSVNIANVTVNDGNNGNNYALSYQNNTQSIINPYAVNLSGTRSYDATTNANANIFSIGTLVGNETLTLAGAGIFADKNTGSNKFVTLNTLTLGNGTNGGLASNYTFTGGSQTASITPAILSYVATPTTWVTGIGGSALDGNVTGFLANDTLTNSTSGLLNFISPATINSQAGNYAVFGEGLTAQNYSFVQALENASALHVIANSNTDLNTQIASLEASTTYLNSLINTYSTPVNQAGELLVSTEDSGINLPFPHFVSRKKELCIPSKLLYISEGFRYLPPWSDQMPYTLVH